MESEQLVLDVRWNHPVGKLTVENWVGHAEGIVYVCAATNG